MTIIKRVVLISISGTLLSLTIWTGYTRSVWKLVKDMSSLITETEPAGNTAVARESSTSLIDRARRPRTGGGFRKRGRYF